MSKKILFFGNERLATGVTTTAPTLRALIKADYEVVAVVVAQNDRKPSRKQQRLEVAEVAAKHNIPLMAPAKLGEAKGKLRDLKAEIGVLVSYGKVVPQDIIDIFPKGIINIHPSLLPLHRGSTPIESVILNGEEKTGVSLMRLTDKVDAGPVYAQSVLEITQMTPPKRTKQVMADILLDWGVGLLLDYLPRILDGSQPPAAPQYGALATHDKLIKKEDGIMSFYRSAEELEREIRAYAGWPRSRTTIYDKEVIITQAKIVVAMGPSGNLKTDEGKLIIFCHWGTALEIESLIPAGKKEMSAKAFLAGNKPL